MKPFLSPYKSHNDSRPDYSITVETCSEPLNTYPSTIKSGKLLENGSLTLGDLHANWLKLLWHLIQRGLCSLKQELYEALACLYEVSLAPEKIEDKDRYYAQIKKILHHIKVNVPNDFILRFIGDTFFDRGPDDRVTRDILQLLFSAGLKTEETISNHTIELILAYENLFFLSKLHPSCGESFLSIESELKTDTMKNFMPQLYSRLNLVCYEIGMKNGKKNLHLLLHAPNLLETIIYAIKEMGININLEEKISTIDTLTRFIDKMNTEFRRILLHGTYREKYDLFSKMLDINNPLYQLIWQRSPSLSPGSNGLANIDPQLSITLSHGHDYYEGTSWHKIFSRVYNLNNFRGYPAIQNGSEDILICRNPIKMDLQLDFSVQIMTQKENRDFTPIPIIPRLTIFQHQSRDLKQTAISPTATDENIMLPPDTKQKL